MLPSSREPASRVEVDEGPDEEQQEHGIPGGGGAEERDTDGEHEDHWQRRDPEIVVPDQGWVDVGINQLPVAGRVPPEQGHAEAGYDHMRKVEHLRELVRSVPTQQRRRERYKHDPHQEPEVVMT